MTRLTKLRIRKKGEGAELLALVNHPMESGWQRDDAVVEPDTSHCIDRITFTINGKVVAVARLGPGVAAKPLTGVAVGQVRPGDKVTVSWTDNRGESGGAEAIAR